MQKIFYLLTFMICSWSYGVANEAPPTTTPPTAKNSASLLTNPWNPLDFIYQKYDSKSTNRTTNFMFQPFAGDEDTLNDEFMNPGVDVTDPCTCRNNVETLDNGDVSDAGLFDDEIVVVSTTAADAWQIIEDTTDMRPLPFSTMGAMADDQPEDLMRVAEGTQLTVTGSFTENGTVYFVYSLPVIHQDNSGYSVAIVDVSGTYTDTLRTGNTCFYPEPFIANILAAYSPDCDEPVTIMGTELNGAAVDDFVFTLTGTGATVFGPLVITDPASPEITFDPNNLGQGDYVAIFELNAGEAASEDNTDPGCVTTVQQEFSVIPAPDNLVCNNNVSVSLDQDCEVEILPDNILEGDQFDYDLFRVEIMDEFGNSRGNTVTRDDLGRTLMVAVIDNCSGNSCMGSITVEDKFAPRFMCPAPITVACTFDLDSIPAPMVIENCDTTAVAILTNEVFEDFGCDGVGNIVARVTRTYIARDANGNTSRACEQVINLEKFSLADVVFPLDFNGMPGQNDPLSCSDMVNVTPDSTGFPTINGGAIDGNDLCKIVASFTDERLDNCGGSFDIVRTWSVFDWCEPLVPGTNPRTDVQVIKVMDNEAPTITCLPSITLNATNNNCTTSTVLPAAVITDNCSAFRVRVSTPRGILESNGGQINNLPIGNYTITYSATDDCGNTSTCDVAVNVVDNIGPFVILEDKLTVTLNNGGMVEVLAESFNDNSYDNCTDQISLAVKRAGTDDPFTPSVMFACPDSGQDINVMVRVTDTAGNETIGWSMVCVRDDSAPQISGPPSPITIDCTDDITDLDLTGRATVLAGCGSATLTFEDFFNVANACGEATVSRVFTARDESGNESTFVQIINVNNERPPLTLADITFPRDTIAIDACLTGVRPTDLPPGYDVPQIDLETCTTDQIAISFSDEVLDIIGTTDGACVKILRTWVVIDWCEFEAGAGNAGRFEDIQVIKLIDNDAPILECPQDLVIDLNESNCSSGAFTIPQPTITDCNPNLAVIQSGDLGSNPDVENIAAGVYTVGFAATDGCGNTGRCQFTVTVRDTRAPQGQCSTVNNIQMTNGQVEVDATRFVTNLTDNCTPTNELVVAYSQNVNDVTRIFTCNDRGENTLQIYARDAVGNWTEICRPVVNIIDADNSCPPGLIANIDGLVHTDAGDMVEEVMIYVNGGMTDSVTTDINGRFAVSNLPLNGDYTFTPSRTDDVLNGVTTFDMVLILKHILGLRLMDTPYQMIAADINKSGSITTLDMVQLRKVLLGYETEFPNNSAWRFVLDDYQFMDNTNPFTDDFPEVYNVNDLTEENELADFVAIKIGDINGDAIPNMVVGIDERHAAETKTLTTAEQTFRSGETLTVPVYATDLAAINGMQFDLQFATDLQLTDIVPAQQLTADNFGTVNVAAGTLSVSWATAAAVELDAEQPLFTLVFTAQRSGSLSEAIQITPTGLQPEVYLADTETTANLQLQIGTATPAAAAVTLFQNQPNPFRQQTTVSFQLGQATTATLSVFDVTGKVIYQRTADYTVGYHEVELSNLAATGILYYQLESETFVATKKMILLD